MAAELGVRYTSPMTRSFRPLFPRLHLLLLCVCLVVQGQVMAMGGVWPEAGQDTDVASNRRLDGAQAQSDIRFPPALAPLLLICDASHRWIRMSDCASLHPTYGLSTLRLLNGGIMMFPMEMPYAPEDQTTAVIVADAGMAKPFDFILKACKAIPTNPDSNPITYKDGLGVTHWNAEYFISPAVIFRTYLQDRDRRAITDMSVFKNVVLLEAPKYGHIVMMNEEEVNRADYSIFHFTPTPNYVGKDKAVFAVEYQGKRYRVDVELILVSSVMDEDCAARLIKIKKSATVTPVSEASYPDLANWYQNLSLQALLAGAKDALTGFADLPGASLGQTTGDKITLDTDAAGHTWFIEWQEERGIVPLDPPPDEERKSP
jgi:hypothetical protein